MLKLFFITIYLIIFLILSFKNLKNSVYLVILTLPLYLVRFKVFGLPTTILEFEILILFVVFFIRALKYGDTREIISNFKSKIINFKLLLVGCSLLLIASIISIFMSPNLYSAVGLWRAYFLEPFLFFIVFISIMNKEDFRKVIAVLGLNVLILSLFALYQKFTGEFITNPFWAAEATRRVTSIFTYPNALALYLAPVVIMLLGFFVAGIEKQKLRVKELSKNWKLRIENLLLILSCILGFTVIYFTKSKGGLLAVLVGIIFYAFFYKPFRKYFLGFIIIVFLFLFFYILMNGLPNFKGDTTVVGGDSISTRLEMWSETVKMLKTRPLLGSGINGYQSALASFHQKQYIEIFLYPHNIFLTFWSETGLLGLTAFIIIVGWFYVAGFRKTTNDRQQTTDNKRQTTVIDCKLSTVLMASMIALLVHGLVDVPYFKNDLAVLFWLLIGMMIVVSKTQNSHNLKQCLGNRN